ALLEDGALVGLRLGDDLGGDDEARGRLEVRAFAGQQDVGEVDAIAGATGQLLDDDLVSRGDAILLAARAHDCEHCFYPNKSVTAPSSTAMGQALARKACRLWQGGEAVN